jgi:hypothetical protein
MDDTALNGVRMRCCDREAYSTRTDRSVQERLWVVGHLIIECVQLINLFVGYSYVLKIISRIMMILH